jgi:hypothetical protein
MADEFVPTHPDAATQDQPPPEVVLLAAASGNDFTVTVANPTPPTNIAYNAYGTPPTPASMVAVDDGTPGALTAIAAPLSIVAGSAGVAAEATGTVVVDTEVDGRTPSITQSVTVMGNYSSTANASHPSSQAPGTLPTITGLAPNNIAGTGGTATLVVTGTGYRPASIIQVAGAPVATQYTSATELRAPAAPKRTASGNSAITVMTNGTATAPTNWVFT